jgi:2-polyprenyl-3-methyl-5-hydroxy-6-metoxy-1,4-benzoquinol methylase
MAEQNADQIADWNGQSGERWVAYQARLDAMLAAFGQAAIEAAAPATGERVLDIGCGAGASSLALAARVGAGGQVLGVDISEPLIGRARALAPQDTSAVELYSNRRMQSFTALKSWTGNVFTAFNS